MIMKKRQNLHLKKKKGHTECLSIVDINDSTKVT